MGSSPLKGSSRITRSGPCMTVVMNWTFCCMPLESSSTFLPYHAAPSKRSSHWRAAASAPEAVMPFSRAR